MEIIYGLEDIDIVAEKLIKEVQSKIILLYGTMGVGKTTLVKSMVKALGSHDEVSSPTFSILNEYMLKNGKLFHFDLYRIEDIEEALNFGIEDYLYSEEWVLIEWPELIKSILPNEYDEVYLTESSENKRKIVIKRDYKV